MIHLSTYFDKNYLSRGLVLYESLKKKCTDFHLYVLCLDKYTIDYFLKNSGNYKNVTILTLGEIEDSDEALLQSKQNRSTIEYYFTLSPCLPLYLLKKFDLPHICTLDADILFLDDPKHLFDYLVDYSVIITPHKFSQELKSLERYGLYNVSFQIFKNDTVGIACLTEWKKQCIHWCYDFSDEEYGRFADQKYLDAWPLSYPGKVKILNDAVNGIAPWNLNNYKIKKKKTEFYSNEERIIFYHFHHCKALSKNWISNGFYVYNVRPQKMANALYFDYWEAVDRINRVIKIDTESSIRQHFSGDLISRLREEVTVFFRFNRYLLWSLDLRTLHPILKRILFKFYGNTD